MPSSLRQWLERLAQEKAPGPTPSFSPIHLLLAMELIAEQQIGRNKLAQQLSIGEGAIRTLVGRLKGAGIIKVNKLGCSLTEKGLQLWKQYENAIAKTKIENNELTFSDYNYAVLVRNGGHKVKTGMDQRDAAVRVGAKSATTLLLKNGHLAFPAGNEDTKDFPKATRQILKLNPRENDVVVIVSADGQREAEHGALAAALTLLA